MRRSLIIALGVIPLLVAAEARTESLIADTLDTRYRLSGGAFLGGHFVTDQVELGNSFFDDQVPESGFLLGLRLGWVLLPHLLPGTSIDPRLSVEAEGKFAITSTAGNDMRPSEFAPVFGWRIHALVDFWSRKRFTPFALVGVGGESVLVDSRFLEGDTDAAMHFGLGARYDFGARYGLRADVRTGFLAGRESSAAPIFETHLGMFYRFGKVREARPSLAANAPQIPAAPDIAQLDSDGDGITGDKDKCPLEAEDLDGVEDTDGCPDDDKPSATPSIGVPDGLLEDVPPAAQPPVAEPPAVEPADTGTAADDKPIAFTIPGIRFERGSRRLTNRAKSSLDTAVLMLQTDNSKVEISGHTDNQGREDSNRQLSLDRAEAVKAYFVENGISADRLTTVGHGSAKPIAPNDSPRGRRKNRRIEFRVLTP